MSKVRVRYAPSPTGLLHIGNARSALFNYLFARHYKGEFIIRIEDTDILRNVEDGEKSQLKYLSWLGLEWDESPDKGGKYGPYRQLERLDLYREYANLLLEKGLAYKDFREGSDNYAIRFKVDSDKQYSFDDLVRGSVSFQGKDIEDWIILKDNGIPTYNFAVVIDDHLMEISHVLRGEEHITNTPKQIMIYEAFNWDIPKFGHMTIIVNEEKKKLSKRDVSVIQFIQEYEDLGYLPEAMFNFISLLGWSPKTDLEVLSKEEIINYFDPERLSKAPAMFDQKKLTYINSRYIKMLTDEQLANMSKKYFEKEKIEIKSNEWLLKFVSIFKDRMSYISEITSFYKEFFHSDFKLNDEALNFLIDNNSLNLIKTFKTSLENLDDFESNNIDQLVKEVGKLTETKGKPLFMGLRIATTGDMHGPSLSNQLEILGKEKVLDRLNKVIEILTNIKKRKE